MALKITVSGVPGWDGEYPLDVSYFTMRELRTIKNLAGVRAGELQDALAAGDNDVIVAFTSIAIRRKLDRDIHPDLLWDSKTGSILVENEDDEPDPPAATLVPEAPDGSGSGTSGTTRPSGESSDAASA